MLHSLAGSRLRVFPRTRGGFFPIQTRSMVCLHAPMKKLKLTSAFAVVFVSCALSTAQAAIRIMPFGDSVTSSENGHDSYRRALYLDLVNAGFNPVSVDPDNGFDFVGRQFGVGDNSMPPDPDFDMNHEGYEGLTTADGISVANGAAGFHPDIVLLDLGSNDPIDGIAPGDTRTNLDAIIEIFHNANPNVVILLAVSTPEIDVSKRDMSLVRKAQMAAIKDEKRAGVNVQLVDLAGGFSIKKDTYDLIHPDESGEKKIASRFLNHLRRWL